PVSLPAYVLPSQTRAAPVTGLRFARRRPVPAHRRATRCETALRRRARGRSFLDARDMPAAASVLSADSWCPLCRPHHELAGLHQPVKLLGYAFQLFSALGRQLVKPCLAVVFGSTPLGREPTFHQHPVERRIQGAFLDFE